MNNLDLQHRIVAEIERILDWFGIEYFTATNHVSLSCPIHGSDNLNSLSIKTDDGSGIWKCWTKGCHDEKGQGIINLIAALLSIKYKKKYTYNDATNWCLEFLKIDAKIDRVSSPLSNDYHTDRKINSLYEQIHTNEHNESKIARSYIQKSLDIPCDYFVNRHFAGHILQKYDVGMCNTPRKKFYKRAVVPIYDHNHEYSIGCLARTTFDKCKKCKMFHTYRQPCPTQKNVYNTAKWMNDFDTGNILYNYWFAKDHIQKDGLAILVEGVGDVWKLEESGISYGLGMFGTSLKLPQQQLLKKSGIRNLIIATDADEAGTIARNKIMQQCVRYYNCYFVDLPKNDLGEMTVRSIGKTFNSLLERLL